VLPLGNAQVGSGNGFARPSRVSASDRVCRGLSPCKDRGQQCASNVSRFPVSSPSPIDPSWPFDEGVTAIVGPNGCGKSNVADAITWVLGEQSAKSLRGEKMEDVIFNGSDARKPGATAEVRLRLSGLPSPQTAAETPVTEIPSLTEFHATDQAGHGNGHGNGNGNANGNGHAEHLSLEDIALAFTRDVEVTRRLYRSGESEYLIDGEVCRLRDVHELMMDTWARREGLRDYRAGQDRHDPQLAARRSPPVDRRGRRYHEVQVPPALAELKLEAAQQNLTRIDDIVFEVEKQRGALKRQAAKARRYKRLREELRRWEKVLFARRYRELAQTIEIARTRLAEAREREGGAAGQGQRS
jgi:chromosome segregation protein